MRILIVTMYFPPAGGAGVPRPLKFAKHLAELGFETHVLAPDDPKWVQRDEGVAAPEGVVVHRARNLGPRARRSGEELPDLRGLERLGAEAAVAFRRLLVPDASVIWSLGAIPAALRLARRHRIDAVLTTSPPGSVHLVGLAARRAGVRWVADLRDPIATHPHRRRHVRGERKLARLVARRADAVVAAWPGIAEEMRELGPPARLAVIENGCDFEDFDGLEYRGGERFRITHTGTFIGERSPRPFLEALARVEGVQARFVGEVRRADRAWIADLGLGDRLELVPYRPRAEAFALQRDSEALLLPLPARERDVVPAKLFEYLAAGRPILASVPEDGETARIVREAGAGPVVPPDDVDAIAAALAELEGRWRQGTLEPVSLSEARRERLSRRARANELADVLRSLPRLPG